MNKRHPLLPIILFWLILLLPAGLGLLGYRAVNFENRKLAPLPAFPPASLLDEGFYRGLSAWLEDHIPLRNLAVAVKSVLVRHRIASNSFDSVVLGRDGWLYLGEALRNDCGTNGKQAALAEALREFTALVAARGKTLYLVIPPNKATLYPEHLPERERARYTATHERNARLQQRLHGLPGLAFVDIEPLLREQKRAGGPLLYYATDTHWNCHGAAVMADALVNRIQPGLARPVTIDDARTSQLDLDRMIGHRVQRPFMLCASHPAVAPAEPGPLASGLTGRRFTAGDDTPGALGGRTLVVYDSFMDALLPDVLPGYFADVHFVHANACGNLPAFAEELRKADRIVLELVERSFCQWSGYVIANRKLLALLREQPGPGERDRDAAVPLR